MQQEITLTHIVRMQLSVHILAGECDVTHSEALHRHRAASGLNITAILL